MHKLMNWLLTLGLCYLTLLLLVWLLQGCMIHIPDSRLVASPGEVGLAYENLQLKTSDGEQLHGWFLPHQEPRAVLLFFHGNAGNISHRLESLEIFHQLKLSTLIIDYRGYGKSSGRPTESGLYDDARTAYRHLVQDKGVPPERIIAFGRSLGAAVAARLASEQPVGALWLESGFTSIPDIGAEIYPFLPVRLLTRYRYDTKKALASVQAPVLVIHSREDETIPFSHGQALYRAAPEPREFLQIRGGHNDGFMRSEVIYRAGLEAFLDRFL